MCRYGFHTYKDHFACFDCRKTFRVRPAAEWVDEAVRAGDARRVVKCPDCGRPMANMGLDFKSPRRRDAKQWEKVRLLYRVGIAYGSCGCGGPGPRPQSLGEARALLGMRRKPRR